ncbi:SUF system Fe-S cluster assembly regulator [Thioalkalivibrio paradoxus]|uniref:Rrf2 family transcriptional regulator n=1 Tax=Thioalkalivibrio paradoxus ARh 1 TaxID=713585 RepID=W0DMH1_9GAMM|nr:SUF system Fe-S cluster assembly regulator [Thioalkalivibrio paradoxus]AHE98095.1 Rrf2 family transcriptional regulator [Thioalkalivibrio paradoxus ARh 1]
MLRISKLSDYAIVLLCEIAREQDGQGATARQLAANTRIALPTVIKLLKLLKDHGVLLSMQGRNGGYRLARPAAQTNLAVIIEAVEGPIALTECMNDDLDCQIHHNCNTRPHWEHINAAFRQALSVVNLNDLTHGTMPVPVSWGEPRTPAL